MNPIARMMKRYIKTPLRYALPLLFIGALVLVSMSGCVSSNTTSNTGSNGGGGYGVSVTDSINSQFSQAGYTVVTPFTQSTDSNGNAVYKGVVDDGAKILQPYRNTLTIVMLPDRTSATKEYNAAISTAQGKGYTSDIIDQTALTSWYADTGTMTYPNQQVKIVLSEPSIVGVNVYGTTVFLDINSNLYSVCSDYQSPTS
ncbi:MAG: hypothetical protein WCG09_02365 [Halobacteriota archaeon]